MKSTKILILLLSLFIFVSAQNCKPSFFKFLQIPSMDTEFLQKPVAIILSRCTSNYFLTWMKVINQSPYFFLAQVIFGHFGFRDPHTRNYRKLAILTAPGDVNCSSINTNDGTFTICPSVSFMQTQLFMVLLYFLTLIRTNN